MKPEELKQCLEEAFGSLEPPEFDDLTTFFGVDRDFEEAVKTGTAKARRWQELRPLKRYLVTSLCLHLLTGEARQYYLPDYLYAMTDPEDIWRYLGSVLSTLWYEDEYGDPLVHNQDLRGQWEELAALLTDAQK
jgi:hypothetical protein